MKFKAEVRASRMRRPDIFNAQYEALMEKYTHEKYLKEKWQDAVEKMLKPCLRIIPDDIMCKILDGKFDSKAMSPIYTGDDDPFYDRVGWVLKFHREPNTL